MKKNNKFFIKHAFLNKTTVFRLPTFFKAIFWILLICSFPMFGYETYNTINNYKQYEQKKQIEPFIENYNYILENYINKSVNNQNDFITLYRTYLFTLYSTKNLQISNYNKGTTIFKNWPESRVKQYYIFLDSINVNAINDANFNELKPHAALMISQLQTIDLAVQAKEFKWESVFGLFASLFFMSISSAALSVEYQFKKDEKRNIHINKILFNSNKIILNEDDLRAMNITEEEIIELRTINANKYNLFFKKWYVFFFTSSLTLIFSMLIILLTSCIIPSVFSGLLLSIIFFIAITLFANFMLVSFITIIFKFVKLILHENIDNN